MEKNHSVPLDDHLLDRPIVNDKQDVLGYGQLAATLGSTILALPNTSTLAVGIDGVWGSGKSSILQLLCKYLQATSKDASSKGVGLIVVPFSPWLISNRTALISEFFEQLDKAIDTASRRTQMRYSLGERLHFYKCLRLRRRSVGKHIRSARKAMSRFAGLATLASTAVSAVDPTLNSAVVANMSGRLGRAIEPGERSLEKLKSQLVQCLRQIGDADSSFRIVVVIDDLDRLDPEDALEVLRLVKTVADFPSITYLLAYDRHALATSISQSGLIGDGYAYLEKIVQFSFKVPPLEPFRLRR
ncbi:MAG: P-loop NTPase fold protein [Albidovulum sp.]|nr:P-loop NTPase fold protein [Albidovulum sp.]